MMFKPESTQEERDEVFGDVQAWLEDRRERELCALSNHAATAGILCDVCESDRLASASITRTMRGEGLTYSNAELFAQERYVIEFFVHRDRSEWEGLVATVTESIDEELAEAS